MKIFCCFLLITSSVYYVRSQTNWVGLARLVNPTGFFSELMQETMHEVEIREWCNLKLLDIHQTLNEPMYDWLVTGEVTYTNGFLVSIQKIDLSNFGSSVTTRTVEGNPTVVARVTSMLNLRDVTTGYDAVVSLDSEAEQRYSGTYRHTLIQLSCAIEKDLQTSAMTSSCGMNSLSGGIQRMIYMPANNVTEVLSRRYLASGIWDSVAAWGRDTIAPIMLDVTTNKVPFPEICYNNC